MTPMPAENNHVNPCRHRRAKTLPGTHDRAVVTDTSHTAYIRRAVTLPGLSAPIYARKERLDVAAGEDTSHILSGLTNQLPDRDPEETAEWVESLDALIREQGTERAQYIMRSLLQRAGAGRRTGRGPRGTFPAGTRPGPPPKGGLP